MPTPPSNVHQQQVCPLAHSRGNLFFWHMHHGAMLFSENPKPQTKLPVWVWFKLSLDQLEPNFPNTIIEGTAISISISEHTSREAGRMEQRLHTLTQALGSVQGKRAHCKFQLEMANVWDRVMEVQEGWMGKFSPTLHQGIVVEKGV
ncbi:hypothetical protein EDB92DRAFT_1820889 [Lactarius akahatsu]|uniref:Uncharacterized protein n=1 Tax=Lactarius akahatsu TaxID=416441 RepID=A0AAD4L631_9AGAM|nr:hypothetical protein EDB92DRAFT_1820889 [Lactarius akahatsu]